MVSRVKSLIVRSGLTPWPKFARHFRLLRFSLFATTELCLSPLAGFGGCLLFWRLCRHHRVRLPNQLLQLVPRRGIDPIEHDPLVTSDIRRRTNILTFNQLGKNLWRALEAEPRVIQAHDCENLSANLETKIVTPLQILGCMRKCQAKFADCVCIHFSTQF